MDKGELLKKAKERNYHITAQTGDGTIYYLHHSDRPIALKLYATTGDFELDHMIKALRLTTDKCGSFMNDEHFNRIERDIRKVIFNLM